MQASRWTRNVVSSLQRQRLMHSSARLARPGPPPAPPPPSSSEDSAPPPHAPSHGDRGTTQEFGLSVQDSSSPPPAKKPSIPFNTHAFIRELESNAGFDRELATAVMEATRGLLVVHEEAVRKLILSKQEHENSAYLFQAAMSELKAESQVQRKNDMTTLQGTTSSSQREMDAMSQMVRDDIASLNSDIQLDMNTRKEETSAELKQFEIDILELNNKYMLDFGDVRTEIESTKWISTRRVMLTLVGVVVVAVAVVSSRMAGAELPLADPPTVEELGIVASDETSVAPTIERSV